MKLIFSFCVCMLLTLSVRSNFFRPFKSWEATLTQSKKENKPILLYFGAPWCAPCVTLTKYIFPNDTVMKSLGDKFIAHKFNVDLEESFAFKAKFRIVSVPLIVVLNADGYLIERIGTIPVTVSDFLNVLSPTINKKTVYKGVGNKLELEYPDFYRNYFFQRTPSTVDTLAIRKYLDTVSGIFDEMNWNIVSVFGATEREYFLFAKNTDSLTKLYGQEVGEKMFFLNQSITQKFLSRGDYRGYKLFLDQIVNTSSVEKREGWVRTCAIREIKFLVTSAYDWELTKVKIKNCYDTYGGSSSLFTLNYIYNTEVPVHFASHIVDLFKSEPTINDYYDRQYEFGVICLKAKNFNLARSFFERSLLQCSDITAKEKLSGEIVKAKVKYGMTEE